MGERGLSAARQPPGEGSNLRTTRRKMSSFPLIRRALPDERTGVVATVTAAFADDPGWAFILGEEYEELAVLPT